MKQRWDAELNDEIEGALGLHRDFGHRHHPVLEFGEFGWVRPVIQSEAEKYQQAFIDDCEPRCHQVAPSRPSPEPLLLLTEM
jgi:hypothetical protein